MKKFDVVITTKNGPTINLTNVKEVELTEYAATVKYNQDDIYVINLNVMRDCIMEEINEA
jgi:hypothetical protein